jgi:hypothetical protein
MDQREDYEANDQALRDLEQEYAPSTMPLWEIE